VYDRVHVLKQQLRTNRISEREVIEQVGRSISDETWLLCLDEMQVTSTNMQCLQSLCLYTGHRSNRCAHDLSPLRAAV
jgi:predicted ATPase